MSEYKTPQYIHVGSVTYIVTEDKAEIANGRRGGCFKEEQEIRISPSLGNDQKRITLLHEILHACIETAGCADKKLTEEEWVERVSPILDMVMVDNPQWYLDSYKNRQL